MGAQFKLHFLRRNSYGLPKNEPQVFIGRVLVDGPVLYVNKKCLLAPFIVIVVTKSLESVLPCTLHVHLDS